MLFGLLWLCLSLFSRGLVRCVLMCLEVGVVFVICAFDLR